MIKASNKLKYIIGLVLGLILLGGLVYAFVIPRYSISVTNSEVSTKSDKNGVRYVQGVLEVECNASRSNDEYICKRQKVSGDFGSNKKVNLAIDDGAQNQDIGEGQFSFLAEQVSFKAVAIREKPVEKEHSRQHKLTMKNEQGAEVLVYNLTVKTILTDNDSSMVNAEPKPEEIKVALETVDTITDVCIANEDNDPNNKLGKPGTYYIKVIFDDSRAPEQNEVYDEATGSSRPPKDTCEKGNEAGGSIEVFRSRADAENRKKKLDALAGGFFDSGTSKIVNVSVIRTSGELKASEQTDLEAKLMEALTQ